MPSIPGPDNITRVELRNGIVVLIYENHASPSVVVRGHLRAGSLFDPAEQPGLAGFTAAMLDEGTETRLFQEIAEQTERVGASVSFGAGVHLVGFSAKGLSEDLPLLLDISSDILLHPTFPRTQMEKVRGEILTALRERQDSTQAMASLAFRKLAYRGHPYARDSMGTPESISALRRRDLVKFYRRTYRPESMHIAVVGDVHAAQTLKLLEKFFGVWRVSGAPLPFEIPPARPLKKPQRKRVRMKNKIQSDIVLGAPALPRSSPDFLAAELADVVLGEFGLMGRLGDVVRDQLGLAYYARSQLEAAHGDGAWVCFAGVNPQNVETAIEAILSEMRRLQREPLDEAELNDVKDFVTGIQPLRLESNDGIAAALLDIEFYQLGLDYLQRLPSLVRAITPAQVQAAAQRYLQAERYALVVAGP